jgi:hypothetical protein
MEKKLNNSTSALIPNTTSVPTTVDVTNKKLHTKDVSILCPHFNGGLGNMMFQFASTFGIAMSKNMSVVLLNLDKVSSYAQALLSKRNLSLSHADVSVLTSTISLKILFNSDPLLIFV